jgi:glycosyltransferase involved in cell wall biosynthesis
LKGAGFVATNAPLIHLHTEFVKRDLHALVASSGVSLDEFDTKENKVELKKKLGFDTSRKTILYTGHLYPYKGADTLANAAKLLSHNDCVFIGGMQGDIEAFKDRFSNQDNIQILGHKHHKDIALYLKAADLLVIPNSAKDSFSLLYTSPIKLFEYMASGTPIVASDLPSIREILNESLAYFFTPDDASSLARTIQKTFDEESIAKAKALATQTEVQKYSYAARAKKILAFLDTLK